MADYLDIMYEPYVKEKIEAGLADISVSRTIPHKQVKTELLDSEN